ncbi:MAG: hypothetical protein V4638_07790 [Bacteroidota bacterium]
MKPLIFAFSLFLSINSFGQNHWGTVTESEFTNEALDVEIDANGDERNY